jgi:hypothetical protein
MLLACANIVGGVLSITSNTIAGATSMIGLILSGFLGVDVVAVRGRRCAVLTASSPKQFQT